MNRPRQIDIKYDPNKRQRNFNIQTITDEQTDTDYSSSILDEYEQLIASLDEQQDRVESLEAPQHLTC